MVLFLSAAGSEIARIKEVLFYEMAFNLEKMKLLHLIK